MENNTDLNKKDLYVVVTWPDSQELMELKDFDENCHLINDDNGIDFFGSSAFFVNLLWLEKTLREKHLR